MIIRNPAISDAQAIVEMYADWPMTEKGPMTLDRVVRCIKRWRHRSDETCWVGITDQGDVDEEKADAAGIPVGLILYIRHLAQKTSTVYEMVVHPDHRGKGYMDQISRACWAYDVEHYGIEKAEFAVRPDAEPIAHRIADAASSGQRIRYKRVSEERHYPPLATGLTPQPLLHQGETGDLIIAEEPAPPLDELQNSGGTQ